MGRETTYRFRIEPILAAALLGLLGGCASTPESLRGEFAPLAPEAATEADLDERVRWGGTLLAVRPEKRRTCLEILARPTDDRGRPASAAEPGRRFLACREGFMDPAAFPSRRSVTVTGRLERFVTRDIGDYEYRFPVVALGNVHVWPKPVESRPPPWWYDPFFPHPYPHPYFYPRRYW